MLNECTPVYLATDRGLNSIASTVWEAAADSLLLNMENEAPQDQGENVRDMCSAPHGLPSITGALSLGKRP